MKVSKPKIWLSSPHMGGTEMQYIQKAFDTNWIAPLGDNLNQFEKRLKQELGGTKEVACVSSGTAAIHLALILAGVTQGDEVICQSFTFSASANPIVYQGATPVFVDSENDTWNMCPELLEASIKDRIVSGKKPRAIIVVHLYGMPAKIEAIAQIAKKFDIILIEDAAEALGSTYKNSMCGTFGDFGVLSFNGNKIITTSGGGAVICKNEVIKTKAIFYATQSRDEAPHYQHSSIGYNYRMSNVLAGIGIGQMEVLHAHIEKRRANHFFYRSLFENIEDIEVFDAPDDNYFSNHWLSTITITKNSKYNLENLRLLLDEAHIESRPLWKPMHLQPVFKKYPFYGSGVSESLFKRGLCLPSGSNLSNDDRSRIAEVITSYFK